MRCFLGVKSWVMFCKHVDFFKVFFWKLVPSPWESIFAKMCKSQKNLKKYFSRNLIQMHSLFNYQMHLEFWYIKTKVSFQRILEGGWPSKWNHRLASLLFSSQLWCLAMDITLIFLVGWKGKRGIKDFIKGWNLNYIYVLYLLGCVDFWMNLFNNKSTQCTSNTI